MLPGCEARYSARCFSFLKIKIQAAGRFSGIIKYLECSCIIRASIRKITSEFSFVPNSMCFLRWNMVLMKKDTKDCVHEIIKEKGIDLHDGSQTQMASTCLLLLVFILVVI
ncbi:hypothetical protein KP509_14G088700 [Ceratopteris richardii]|uniref:Uncharacterized protein n=1 Tax=Ceratopteris richardii TaxID=49495 RepID=A0A8T2TA37_CERRI|nr:hypothetical protein KP509_14G088700 [Ceratopteris richardii]